MEGSEQVVGATVMVKHAGDMISEVAVAMQSKKGIAALTEAIHPFPAQAQAIHSAAATYRKTLLQKQAIKRSA